MGGLRGLAPLTSAGVQTLVAVHMLCLLIIKCMGYDKKEEPYREPCGALAVAFLPRTLAFDDDKITTCKCSGHI